MNGPRSRSALTFASCLLVLSFIILPLPAQEKPTSTPGAVPKRTETIPKTTVTFDLVRIPGGTFTMKTGDEEKEVTVKPFWIGRTEVTWDEYDVFYLGLDLPAPTRQVELDKLIEAKTRPSRPHGKNPDNDFGHAGFPAIRPHYNAAVMYCKWLSELTGKKYRLATEAEWEWACRAGGDGTRLPTETLEQVAWFKDNAVPDGGNEPQTHPVAKKQPNAYGLHDMLGNVSEWVSVVGVTDQTPEPERYVTKGGHWRSSASALHPGFRQFLQSSWQAGDSQDPKSRWWLSDGNFVGFRVVLED